ncbi:hypothetical protein [Desulfonema magnum]|uniref:Uncharacterized protein n=1 Tax=Desulfonema magnum TaxID=45655 RepID=A0A975BUA7_9BACT|nr:hypothetical protein [Desulfonema magnum]QTA91763.1 Uncharacterized protein dnm_078370 [Desulfonema magnum]
MSIRSAKLAVWQGMSIRSAKLAVWQGISIRSAKLAVWQGISIRSAKLAVWLIITDLGEAGNMTTDSGDETDSTGRYDSGSPKGVSDPESLIPAGSP